MTSRDLLNLSCLAFVFVVASSCQDQQPDAVNGTYLDLPAVPYEYNNLNENNAVTTLGRVLFYDRQLSLNNTTACASCHKQSAGFADNVKFSRGFEGRLTSRNSMPVQNLQANIFAFDSFREPGDLMNSGAHLFWDGRESSLDNLILQPVSNHIEMGIRDLASLTKKLSEASYYAPLFSDAYGDQEVTSERITRAIRAFALSINTTNTRFDLYNQTKFTIIDPGSGLNLLIRPSNQPAVMNPLELEGMLLFQSKYDCNSCHQVQSTFGYQMAGTFANVGLDKEYADTGLEKITGNPADAGKFKIPSLRNVEFTGPYMHDGRFATLAEVIDHYSEGLNNNPNLDSRLKGENGTAKSMNISQHEKDALVAFLKTLSDRSVITDPKFSDPFKVK